MSDELHDDLLAEVRDRYADGKDAFQRRADRIEAERLATIERVRHEQSEEGTAEAALAEVYDDLAFHADLDSL